MLGGVGRRGFMWRGAVGNRSRIAPALEWDRIAEIISPLNARLFPRFCTGEG